MTSHSFFTHKWRPSTCCDGYFPTVSCFQVCHASESHRMEGESRVTIDGHGCDSWSMAAWHASPSPPTFPWMPEFVDFWIVLFPPPKWNVWTLSTRLTSVPLNEGNLIKTRFHSLWLPINLVSGLIIIFCSKTAQETRTKSVAALKWVKLINPMSNNTMRIIIRETGHRNSVCEV